MENYNEDFASDMNKAAQMWRAAYRLNNLNVFRNPAIADKSFDLWAAMTAGGRRMKGLAKGDESPKITFKRFMKRKADEYDAEEKDFRNRYGMDWRDIDLQNSDAMSIKNKKGDIIAP